METTQRERKSTLAVNLGLAANILLAGMKTSIGIIGNSPALLADGINSTSDVAYNIVVAVFIRLARKPADREHPYGHSQLESIAALTVGSFVITTAIAIFWSSISSVFNILTGQADPSVAAPVALYAALLTLVTKMGLGLYTRRLGKETNNPAVMALAYDHHNDVFSSAGATAGILLGRLGIPWGDPLAGALVALLVLRTGLDILRESTSDLMDTVPGEELDRQVRSALAPIPGILDVERIGAHRFGPYLMLNLTIGGDGDLTVAEGDRIASQVEDTLYREVDFTRTVHVHFHPVQQAVREPAPEEDEVVV